jgi:hypothetical protein
VAFPVKYRPAWGTFLFADDHLAPQNRRQYQMIVLQATGTPSTPRDIARLLKTVGPEIRNFNRPTKAAIWVPAGSILF